MPTENDTKTTPTGDESTKDLDKKLADLASEKKASTKDELKDLRDQISALKRENAELKKHQLKSSASDVPDTDYVVLRGKRYGIERTVEAKFATDEARKGYIDMHAELVVLKN